MPEISTAAGSIHYRSPRSVVSTCAKLREAEFVEVPYLRCVYLNQVAAPEIDQAYLEYEYGTIQREDESTHSNYAKLDIVGKFVKVEITDTVLDESDQPVASVLWYGRVQSEIMDVAGTRNGIPTGVQRFVVHGVLSLAQRTPILTSIVEDAGDSAEEVEIQSALPFNQDSGGYFVRRGNRSANEHGTGDTAAYIFSPEQRSLNKWDAYEAVRYLLARHAPKDSNGSAANVWRLHADVLDTWLNWYDVAVECEGRTLKECLDSLIDRRRGVGYYAEFNPEDDAIDVRVFSFVDADVTLPSGDILKANPDQYSLNFEDSLDVDAIVATTGVTQYDKVIARGAKRTTTFTTRLLRTENTIYPALVPDWTSTEENEFLRGASGEPGYDDLDREEKERANTLWRLTDRLRNVFSRWKLNPTWDKLPRDVLDGDTTDWLFVPPIPASATEDPNYVFEEGNDNGPVWMGGVRLLRALPFLDRYDYSGTKIEDVTYGVAFSDTTQPEYVPPFAFVATQKPNTNPVEYEYEHLDKINLSSLATDTPKRWAATFQVVDTEPAIALHAFPQQMLAKVEWAYPYTAATPTEHDPTKEGGVDWSTIRVTLCAEIDEHVQFEKSLGSTPGSDIPLGNLMIYVPDARFDYVAPFTVTEVKGGKAEQSITGGIVRDDRKRLASIAETAAQWYGRNRQTLELNYKQCRSLFRIGWLITSVGANYSLENINTVLTSITYTSDGQGRISTTQIRTSFADLDVL